jgi:rod shape determining protein RodA
MKQPDLGTALLVLAAGPVGHLLRRAVVEADRAAGGDRHGRLVALIVSFEPTLCADGFDWRILHDYQKQRVCTLLDPSKDPLGKGFHIIQGMIAIGSGGVGGKGFMQGTQTHLEFIPERTTDFIFAAYSEEFGLMPAISS